MIWTPDFYTDLWVMVPLLLAAVSAVMLATSYRRIISRVVRYAKTPASGNQAKPLPPLSVIVYSKDSADALARMLPQLLDQQYDAPFEVIVATDGRSMQAEDIVTYLGTSHHNIRMTYVPDEAHALSRKKLAVTLGVKAARYENILLTDANILPRSPHWLTAIGRRIAAGADVVIGTSTIRHSSGAAEPWLEALDTLVVTVSRLSAAIAGHPYRATDKNMAFTRTLFFNNRGFADSVAFHHGIDDIFLSRIAHKGNTAVEISQDAIVELTTDNLHTRHFTDKLRHIFTGRRISRRMPRLMAIYSALMWVWLGATVATFLTALPNIIPPIIALIFGILWITLTTIAWGKAARTLLLPVNRWLLVPGLMLRPLYNLLYRLRARTYRQKNFTWTKGY